MNFAYCSMSTVRTATQSLHSRRMRKNAARCPEWWTKPFLRNAWIKQEAKCGKTESQTWSKKWGQKIWIKERLVEKIFHNPRKLQKNYFQCFAECVLTGTKIFENGQINPKAAHSLVAAHMASEPDFIPIATESINFCSTELGKKKAEIAGKLNGATPDGKEICDHTSSYFMKCLFANNFGNCPDSKFDSKNEGCVNLKTYFKKCPFPPM